MSPQITRRLLVADALALLLTVCLYFTGFIGSSAARVARDHSVVLPPSASHVVCDGFVSITTFGDFSADASFEIAAEDLPALISQFEWNGPATLEPVSPDASRTFVPTKFGKPTALYSGKSHDGNAVGLWTYDLGDGNVGVWILTQWN